MNELICFIFPGIIATEIHVRLHNRTIKKTPPLSTAIGYIFAINVLFYIYQCTKGDPISIQITEFQKANYLFEHYAFSFVAMFLIPLATFWLRKQYSRIHQGESANLSIDKEGEIIGHGLSNGIYHSISFWGLLTLLCSICLYLFYLQTINPEKFKSDLPSHIYFSINIYNGAEGYSFLHYFVNALSVLVNVFTKNVTKATNIVIIAVLVISEGAQYTLIRHFLKKSCSNINCYKIDFIAFALMFISMILFNPMTGGNLYIGTGTPNPWHNPTYIFLKPFSLLVFMYFLTWIENAISKKKNLALLGYTIFAVLSMGAKPSFLMTFLPCAFIMSLYYWLRKKITFRDIVKLGLATIPAMIVFFTINDKLFTENANNQVILVFGKVWYSYTKSVTVSIIFALAFPIYTSLCCIRRLSRMQILAIGNWILSALMQFFLAESGDRMYHMNFGWSYLIALFFWFLASMETFFLHDSIHGKRRIIGYCLLSLHTISGIIYLGKIFLGNTYF